MFTCARNEGDLQQALQEWQGRGWDVRGCVADLADPAAAGRLVEAVRDAFGGKLHILGESACAASPTAEPSTLAAATLHAQVWLVARLLTPAGRCAVNNAGTNRAKPTVDYTQEDFDAVMGLNLQAMFRLCQARQALPPQLPPHAPPLLKACSRHAVSSLIRCLPGTCMACTW